MALSAKVGSFAKPVVTGNQAVSGVGFQPNTLIMFGNYQTADGSATGQARIGLGFSDGTGNEVISNQKGPSNFQCIQVSTKNYSLSLGGGQIASSSLSSFGVDGFTNNWTTSNAVATIVNYIALGGSTITNSKVLNNTAATVGGNQVFSGVGFKPDAVIITTMINTAAAGGYIGYSFSILGNTSYSNSYSIAGAGSFIMASAQTNNACLSVDNATDAITAQASLVSLDADGFTLNWSIANAAAIKLHILCIKGPNIKVGVLNQPNGAGTQAISGVGFTPKCLLLTSTGRVSSATVQTADKSAIMFGAASGTTERGCISNLSAGTVAGDFIEYLSRTKVIQMMDFNSPYSILAAADLNSFDVDGFTLNWTSADATAREVIYLAIGEPPSSQKTTTGVSSVTGISSIM